MVAIHSPLIEEMVMTRRLIGPLVTRALSLLLLLSLVRHSAGAPGTLDPTFGTGGRVMSEFGALEAATALIVQPDGKLVVAGFSITDGGNSQFLLVRYGPDGRLDASFGTSGVILTWLGGDAFATTLVLQPDGKLVVAGQGHYGDGTSDIVLVRYLPTGQLDPGFGTGGAAVTSLDVDDLPTALVWQPDGKLVLAGMTVGTQGPWRSALVRYLPDGRLDPTFGTGGIVGPQGADGVVISALVRQPDGKYVAAGSYTAATTDLLLARFLPDGDLDPTFGAGGIVLGDLGQDERVAALTLQPDGKLVAAGTLASPDGDFYAVADILLVHVEPDGSLDASFGAGGVVLADFGGLEYPTYALVVQPDGRPVVASGVVSCGSAFTLVRYLPDGRLDRAFGKDGLVCGLPGEASPVALALALQPDGKLVVAGNTYGDGSSPDVLLARYLTADGCRGTGPFHIWGRVTDATRGAGLREVGLALTGPGGCMEATATKFQGVYAFPALGEGTYTVKPGEESCNFEPPNHKLTLAGDHARASFAAACIAE
jgi:uncharacterized delta-60 repeat protein